MADAASRMTSLREQLEELAASVNRPEDAKAAINRAFADIEERGLVPGLAIGDRAPDFEPRSREGCWSACVPRMFDYHPDAVKVPYAHANVDSDESSSTPASSSAAPAAGSSRARCRCTRPATCTARSPAATRGR
jgi:hypothetical protein